MLPTCATGADGGGGWRGDERPLNEVVSVTCGRLIGSSSHHRCHQALGDLTDPTSRAHRLSQTNPTNLQPFVRAHRTATGDDWLTLAPFMDAEPERGSLG